MTRHDPLPQSSGEGGQGLLEFSLVLPVLLLLFMAIFDVARLLFLQTQVSNGAREGARYGAVTGLVPGSPQYLNCTGIENAVSGTFGLPQDVQIEIQYDDGQNLIFANCDSSRQPSEILNRYRIVVTVTAQVEFVTPFLREFVPPWPVTFTAARSILRDGTFVPYGQPG